jgi:hypothetical protein
VLLPAEGYTRLPAFNLQSGTRRSTCEWLVKVNIDLKEEIAGINRRDTCVSAQTAYVAWGEADDRLLLLVLFRRS